MGFIFWRGEDFVNYKTIVILYLSFVRSTIEYCSQILNSYYSIHKEQIAAVQKRFSRMLMLKFNLSESKLPYVERLKFINLM